MIIGEANDVMENSHWMASLKAAFSARNELLRDSRVSVSLDNEVILPEDY